MSKMGHVCVEMARADRGRASEGRERGLLKIKDLCVMIIGLPLKGEREVY